MPSIQTTTISSTGIKITLERDGQQIGRVYLYLIYNDLHKEPYGLMEDLYIETAHRGKGYASMLITALIEEAKKQGCYKLIGQSRYGKDEIHAMYEKKGFQNHGYNFRMDIT